jgi:hypothetical protein
MKLSAKRDSVIIVTKGHICLGSTGSCWVENYELGIQLSGSNLTRLNEKNREGERKKREEESSFKLSFNAFHSAY